MIDEGLDKRVVHFTTSVISTCTANAQTHHSTMENYFLPNLRVQSHRNFTSSVSFFQARCNRFMHVSCHAHLRTIALNKTSEQ